VREGECVSEWKSEGICEWERKGVCMWVSENVRLCELVKEGSSV
jgi:hypothetical protein